MIEIVLIAVGLLAVLLWVRRRWPRTETWIEATDLDQRRTRGEEILVADVRGADEFVGSLGHIPGAHNIPVDEVESRLDEFEPGKQRSIVLVCKTDRRSATAAQLLRERGFGDVLVLRDGMVGWNREGLAVEPDPRSPQR